MTAVAMVDAPDQSPRTRLALAIENYRAIAAHVADLERGRDLALDRRIEARRRRDDTQAALNRAHHDEAQQLVSDLLDTSTATRSIAEHEATLQHAEAQYAQACRAAEAVEEALEKALRDMRWARRQLSEAVSAVVLQSEELTALLRDHGEAQRRLQSIENALRYLRARNAVPASVRALRAVSDDPSERDIDPALRTSWEHWLAALDHDPSSEFGATQ
jgi:chromosome segregation ATPase